VQQQQQQQPQQQQQQHVRVDVHVQVLLNVAAFSPSARARFLGMLRHGAGLLEQDMVLTFLINRSGRTRVDTIGAT
jgi:hypothetical protein